LHADDKHDLRKEENMTELPHEIKEHTSESRIFDRKIERAHTIKDEN